MSTRLFSRGMVSVSKSNVKALRYGLLLPLIHVAISVPVIYHEEASYWRYVPRIQVEEDFEKAAPSPIFHSGPMIAWNPCYAYRASTADRFIFAVEFPAGMLIAPHGASGCNPNLLQPILRKLKKWLHLKTRIVLLDGLLALGIAGQWWLVGRWIDRLRERRRHARRWIVPVAAIIISGIIVAAAAFGSRGTLELSTMMLSLIALVAWLALLLMFAGTAVQGVLRLRQKVRSTAS
jgi:hypothetical protein